MTHDFEKLLLNNSPDAVLVTTPGGIVVYWSKSAEAVFGFASDEVIGRSLNDVIVPLDRVAEERKILDEAIETGFSTYESNRRRKDGSLIHVVISNRVIRDQHGQIECIVSSKTDVTQLKVQRDAKSVEAKFHDLLESTADAIIIVNQIGRIVVATREAERLFGYHHHELHGKPTEALLPERFCNAHIELCAKYFAEPHTRAMGVGPDLYALHKNGAEFPVEIGLSALTTDEGTFVMSAIRDISERKRAEQRFRSLLESAPDAIVFFDRKGAIVLVNSQAEKMFGYPRGELLGQKIEILVPQRFREGHSGHRADFFEEPQARGMDARLELYGLRKDGTEFPVEISLNPLETDEGLRGMSAIRDITGRKQIEQALHDKNIELQNAAQAKNRFLANMSHELRTPLNGIIGFSEFLADGKPGPINAKQKEYLEDILTSGRHLLQLINDVLDLAKVESGKMKLSAATFSLRKAIEEVCAVANPIAQKKRIQVTTDIAAALGDVTLDEQKLKQVLYNLLSNAVKFTDDGGSVAICVAPLNDHRFKLTVRDTGIGIQAQDLHRLFREFEQLESGESRRYEGTGLGLALTRRIVELQGGTIAVESEAGKGSLFTVTLPIVAKEVTP